MKVVRRQTFKSYADHDPDVVSQYIEADLVSGLLGYVTHIGALQTNAAYTVWCLWEKEHVE